jgi:hypothetical protein
MGVSCDLAPNFHFRLHKEGPNKQPTSGGGGFFLICTRKSTARILGATNDAAAGRSEMKGAVCGAVPVVLYSDSGQYLLV